MSKKDLTNLIALGEGFTTEFKQPDTSNFGRDICGSANATDEVILIGVTDGGKIPQLFFKEGLIHFETKTGQYLIQNFTG